MDAGLLSEGGVGEFRFEFFDAKIEEWLRRCEVERFRENFVLDVLHVHLRRSGIPVMVGSIRDLMCIL